MPRVKCRVYLNYVVSRSSQGVRIKKMNECTSHCRSYARCKWCLISPLCLQMYVSEWFEIWSTARTEGDDSYRQANLCDFQFLNNFLDFSNMCQRLLVAVLTNIFEIQKLMKKVAQNLFMIRHITHSNNSILNFEQK